MIASNGLIEQVIGISNLMSKPRILIIEDERALSEILEINLQREGFETSVANEGTQGLRMAQANVPDLILLDLMLPGKSGLDICRDLKTTAATKNVPIIMITAKSEETDQLIGFATGADDYVTKPFSVKVLIQRVRRELRRRETGSEEDRDVLTHLGIVIDRVRHKVTVDGRELVLTPTEFRLLEALVRRVGRAFSRNELMDAGMGEDAVVLERTIDVHIKSLRKKLGDHADLIETVRGLGYRMRETPLPAGTTQDEDSD
jgi:two-component system phosphate regulon response regulator PhoB